MLNAADYVYPAKTSKSPQKRLDAVLAVRKINDRLEVDCTNELLSSGWPVRAAGKAVEYAMDWSYDVEEIILTIERFKEFFEPPPVRPRPQEEPRTR